MLDTKLPVSFLVGKTLSGFHWKSKGDPAYYICLDFLLHYSKMGSSKIDFVLLVKDPSKARIEFTEFSLKHFDCYLKKKC